MTGLERVGAALSGGQGDRPAFAPVLSLYGCALTDQAPEAYYRKADCYLKGQEEAARRFDPDVVFGPFALALEAEAFGARLMWPPESPPGLRKPAFASIDAALAALESGGSPEPGRDPRLSYLVESVALLSDRWAGEKPVAAIITAPCDLPAVLIGVDEWIEALLWKPEKAARLTRFTAAHFRSLVSAYAAAGAAFAAMPVMSVNPRIFNSAIVEDLIMPQLREAFAGLPCPLVFHHGGNKINARLGLFKELPGIGGFAIDEADSPSEARGILGPDRLLLSGPMGPLMAARSPEAIEALAARLLTDRIHDPRFILCTTAADPPWDSPPEAFLALRRALDRTAALRTEAAHGI